MYDGEDVPTIRIHDSYNLTKSLNDFSNVLQKTGNKELYLINKKIKLVLNRSIVLSDSLTDLMNKASLILNANSQLNNDTIIIVKTIKSETARLCELKKNGINKNHKLVVQIEKFFNLNVAVKK